MKRIVSLAASTVVLGVTAAYAAPITPGNVVLYRVGDGTALLTTDSNSIFIDEYTPAGSLVQSIPLPTTGASMITATGTIGLEGVLSLSQDKNLIAFAGYRTPVGTANPSGAVPATINRVIGTMDINGTFDLTTALTDVTGVVRSAATTDGSVMYHVGQSGIRHITSPHSVGTTTLINSRNSRQGVISGNVVYTSNGAAIAQKVQSWGTLPTAAVSNAQAGAVVTLNTSDFVQGLSFVDLSPAIPGDDTLYIASTVEGIVRKYTLDGSNSWNFSGSMSADAENLFATVAGGTVSLFFTNGTGVGGTSNSLFSAVDSSGYGGTLSGSAGPAIAQSVTNTAFRGVAVFPTSVVVGSVWASPNSGSWNVGGNWTGGIPNAVGASATFGTITMQATNVTLDIPITVGQLVFDNSNTYTLDGSNTLTLQTSSGDAEINVLAGSHNISAPLTLQSNTVMSGPGTLSAGNIAANANLSVQTHFTAGNIDGTGDVSIAAGANLQADHLRIDALSIDGAAAISAGRSNTKTSQVNTLSLAEDAALDLGSNDLAVEAGSFADIRAAIISGYADGAWNGEGIHSSAAAAATSPKTALGYASNSVLGVGSFSGVTVGSSATLIRYTAVGDAGLNGVVDSTDFDRFIAGYGLLADANWTDGDFNFDGKVNTLDFNLMAGNFGAAVASPEPGTLVPEPLGMSLLLFLPLGYRRARKSRHV